MMKVNKCMTRDVHLVSPTQTLRDAARMMAEIDAGALPVVQDDHLVGMITDRDIAVRAVALGKSPDTTVGEIMSQEVLYCFDDQELEDVARNMGEIKVRRLPVLNRNKRLVGIVSLGDLARKEEPAVTVRAVNEISKPKGRHGQATWVLTHATAKPLPRPASHSGSAAQDPPARGSASLRTRVRALTFSSRSSRGCR